VSLSIGLATLALVSISPPASGQQSGAVQGTVVEAGTNRPLANAIIFVADPGAAVGAAVERIRTATDAEGHYLLSDVPAGRQQVYVRALGYTSERALLTVLSAQTTELDFQLTRTVFALDEIVVSGAGGRIEKKRLGNTIATIDASAFETGPVMNFSEALSAREPSVVGLPSDGLAGGGARVRIRGSSSLAMSNEPVVYIDGARVDNSGGFLGGRMWTGDQGGGGSPSRLDDINPETIERIEILKGAAAATLYGSEASAGVIQIFTKRGRVGAPRFSFRIDQMASRYPDVYKPNAGFARDDAQAATMSELFGIPVRPFEVIERKFVQDLFETGHQHAYSVDVAGGSDDVLYYVAGRASFENGPLGAEVLGPARDFGRKYQGSLNLTLFPRNRFQLRLNTAFTQSHQQTPENNNNPWGGAPVTSAILSKPELANCDASSVDGSRILGETTPFCTGAGNATGAAFVATVRESMQAHGAEQETDHFHGSVTAVYEVSPSVSAEGTFGIDAVNERASWFRPFGWNVDGRAQLWPDGARAVGERTHRELTLDAKIRWSERLGAFSSQLMLGGQGFIADEQSFSLNSFGLPGPGIEVVQGVADNEVFEDALSKVNAGIFAQEQIGFREFAFVTVGGRWDRNSAFGESVGTAFYPKASVSIVPSDLSGFRFPILSTVRVRAAVGQSGLQPGAFDELTTWVPVQTSEGTGFRQENLGNPDLKPERSTEWELGAELGLLDNRVGIDVTYWDRTTTDALVQRQFVPSGGFNSPQLDNVAELKAHGWELKLDALLVDADNVSVDIFANASFLHQQITRMGPAPAIEVGYFRYRNTLQEGFAPGTFFGAQLIPLCSGNPVYSGGADEGQSRPCYTPGSTVPFDSNFDDQPDTEEEFRTFLTSDPEISLNDLNPLVDDEDGDGITLDHRLGKPTPDWQGSFGAQITLWRNVHVNTLLEYRAGDFGVSNLTDAFRNSDRRFGRNTRRAAEVEATLLNPATQGDAEARQAAAMTWATELKSLAPLSGLNLVEKADFVRWRELEVTYTVPASFAAKLGMSHLAISFVGRNLHLFSGYSGIDPEVNAVGRCRGRAGGETTLECNFLDSVDAFGLPLPRRYGVSVRFGF
jgi:TonB-linked SusC/RagA family outer membrane protein